MKVLFFCNLLPVKLGAFETLLEYLGKEFLAHGDHLHLGLAGEPIEEVAMRWKKASLSWEVLPDWTDSSGQEHPWRFVRPACRMIKKHDPDVCVVHFGNELPSLMVALIARTTRGRPHWVWQQHQQIRDPTPGVTALFSRVRLLAVAFDRFVAVYDGGKKSLIRRGIPADRIDVILNAVQAPDVKQDKGSLRKIMGIPDDAVMAVTIGSLIPRKNIGVQIEAVASLGSIRPLVHLVVVGEGVEREVLQALARDRCIPERVHIAGQRNDARSFLSASDVFLLTSNAEASPFALIEAMSVGLLCIVTDAGAAREIVEDGQSGFVIPCGDAKALSEKMAVAVTNPTLRQRMGNKGQERWRRLFCLKDTVTQYRELCASLSGTQ